MIGEAHHYGITVSDLEESVAFYRETLGMDELDRLRFDDEPFSTFVDVEDVDVSIVFLDAGGCAVELLEYESGDGNANENVSNDTVGASHFCLAVDDVERRYEELSDSVEFVSPPQTLENGAQVAYLYDPDGNTVELLEE